MRATLKEFKTFKPFKKFKSFLTLPDHNPLSRTIKIAATAGVP